MIASSDWGAPALELARAFREALLLLLRGRGLALLLRAQLALAMRVALFIRELYQRLLGLRAHSENKTRESGRRKDGARGGGGASERAPIRVAALDFISRCAAACSELQRPRSV